MRRFLIFLFASLMLVNLYADKKDMIPYWIDMYGDYTQSGKKNDSTVKRTMEIFGKVKSAAEKTDGRMPRLFIINTNREPYAMALPDGSVIINTRTLVICYSGINREEGNQRMAFILGHELAHLANKDFMHREAFEVFDHYGDEESKRLAADYFHLPDPEASKVLKSKEHFADKEGVLYAAMAGYDISRMFKRENNFFHHWANQTGIKHAYENDELPGHPSLKTRADYVYMHLKKLAKKIELFRAGVLLYQIESRHDAVSAFLNFSRHYPSREVFNNIGACYLDLALHHLHLRFSRDYYRFRLSTSIDYSTTSAILSPRGDGDYLKDKEIATNLDKAGEYFKLAVERDKLDKASRYNLSTVLILKKEYAGAQQVCEDILKHIDKSDVNARNNKAVALYYYGKEEDVDTAQKAIQNLEEISRREPGNYEVLYNLAALKEKRKRFAGARVSWGKYLKLSSTPRDNFYRYVYKKLNKKEPPAPRKVKKAPVLPGWVKLGDPISTVSEKFGGKKIQAFPLGSEASQTHDDSSINLQVIVIDNIRVLALDGTVEMVEREIVSSAGGKEEMLRRYGAPQRIVRHRNGYFYVYQDRGFSVKEVDGKISSYIWFEKGL
ncbi:MAG: M48 family metalloprotease [bacterium]|nr:M48 family metalloprotease [bacterium]